MKITIIGGGNMGSAIALGIASGNTVKAENIYVTDPNRVTIEKIKQKNKHIQAVTDDYNSIDTSGIIIIAVKPWLVQDILLSIKERLNTSQLLISIAAGISLSQLKQNTPEGMPVFRLMPNTAIAVKQSMTFVTSLNASHEQEQTVMQIFGELGKTELIKEDLFPAATAIASCGIAYAFRYIRAAMEGGVELGFYPEQAKDIVIQTLRGAIDLLDENGSHPEIEIDKVTTAGGVTIKGLNEMESAGFTSAIIKGLKASTVK